MDASTPEGAIVTTIESQLSGALTDLMRAASVRNTEDTTIALRRILDLEPQLGVESPKMLRHYLEQRSYQKALEFLKSGRP
jgi:hypothetical protein